ncbi:MAG: alanine racemase [Clostridiales bacterium]|nr:alanine racemase [Clostridiales bacterium]
MIQHSRICAEIDLDNFDHNLNEIERLISPGTKICAVIKADGYGHGAAALAEIMEQRNSVWGYAVATVEEAMALHRAGLKKPILILGYVFDEDLDTVIGMNIRMTVFTAEMAREISLAAQKEGKNVRIHIKLDTGMSRIGFQCTGEAVKEIAEIAAMPNIYIEGIYTHFARADETDKNFSLGQAEMFTKMVGALRDEGVTADFLHMANSAAIIDLPRYDLDMVRAGIILYGLWPSDEVQKDRIDLMPLMTLKSHIIHVKTLEEGRSVSYGGTYHVEGTKTIATIPVGYADGYPRSLSNIGYVLIRGKKAPICGRVCMDQFMVDVTEIEDVMPGDEVILLGRDGGEEITMDILGELSGRFNYELACDVGKRVPRVYVRRGKAELQIK